MVLNWDKALPRIILETLRGLVICHNDCDALMRFCDQGPSMSVRCKRQNIPIYRRIDPCKKKYSFFVPQFILLMTIDDSYLIVIFLE